VNAGRGLNIESNPDGFGVIQQSDLSLKDKCAFCVESRESGVSLRKQQVFEKRRNLTVPKTA
jgi:hypothetical protein